MKRSLSPGTAVDVIILAVPEEHWTKKGARGGRIAVRFFAFFLFRSIPCATTLGLLNAQLFSLSWRARSTFSLNLLSLGARYTFSLSRRAPRSSLPTFFSQPSLFSFHLLFSRPSTFSLSRRSTLLSLGAQLFSLSALNSSIFSLWTRSTLILFNLFSLSFTSHLNT